MKQGRDISTAGPLNGKTIVVTRPAHQSGEFSDELASLGAAIVAYPTIHICDPESWADADRCVRQIAEYNAIVFTSANAVDKFFQRGRPDAFEDKIIFAVGSKTQEALRSHHATVAVIPEHFTSEDLVTAAAGTGVQGKRILYPRGNRDRGIVRDGLERAGALVDECIVYKTELADSAASQDLKRLLSEHAVHMVTFFSPSSIEGFFESLAGVYPERLRLHEALQGVATAVIGSVTAEALRRHGILPTVIPPVSTGKALVESIVRYYSSE